MFITRLLFINLCVRVEVTDFRHFIEECATPKHGADCTMIWGFEEVSDCSGRDWENAQKWANKGAN